MNGRQINENSRLFVRADINSKCRKWIDKGWMKK
jgi:hypothetical protein